MGFRETGKNIDAEKVSQNKQSKADTKPKTTHEQRIQKYTWSLRDLSKTGFVTFTLGMARIVGGVGAESLGSALNVGSSDNATDLPPIHVVQTTRVEEIIGRTGNIFIVYWSCTMQLAVMLFK
jgi:hypothetical protein